MKGIRYMQITTLLIKILRLVEKTRVEKGFRKDLGIPFIKRYPQGIHL